MPLSEIYFSFFNYISAPRRRAQDMEVRFIHNHLFTVITTGALMWAYAILAILTIASPIPGIVGVTASIVHNLSPFIYRFTNKRLLGASVLLTAGIVHQGTFAYFTGGFMGNIVIWFGVLPFLGALIAGKAGAILWSFLSTMASAVFLLLHLKGHQFPMLITPTGEIYAQAYIAFGWIFLSGVMSYVYLVNEEKLASERSEKKQHLENLFRILCHDIGNPLALLQMSLENYNNSPDEQKKARAMDIAKRAIHSIVDLTQNVRQMYVLKEGKKDIQVSPTDLNPIIDQLQFLFQGPLQHKNISIIYDDKSHATAVVMVEPISFLHQVLGNIISNSIKFSNPNSTINIFTNQSEPGFVKISIQDQGIGIPNEILQDMFKIDSKSNRPGTSGEKGTGFGMSLMKTFVEKYDGEVEVISKEKSNLHPSGTTFILTLKGSLQ
ncbi:MAG: HAMP domain-containing histidine kinase [Bacteriovoracaceae bacterium]|nr:HAMP domain-containing histidine kinase [Bacteriovoracaceae bacterium]